MGRRRLASRRFAAVQLVRVGAASRTQVAAAFHIAPSTIGRWHRAFTERGTAGLLPTAKKHHRR